MATRQTPLSGYLRQLRRAAGLTSKELTAAIGAHGKVNHGGAVSNWETGRNSPSPSQYEQISEALKGTGVVADILPYNDIVRPMSLSNGMEFTDVWNFPSVRPFKGKHPAEKPHDLLTHIISASSYPGDIVLDCFTGSGSTGVASVLSGRRTVCIDIKEKWAKRAALVIANALMVGDCRSASTAKPPQISQE